MEAGVHAAQRGPHIAAAVQATAEMDTPQPPAPAKGKPPAATEGPQLCGGQGLGSQPSWQSRNPAEPQDSAQQAASGWQSAATRPALPFQGCQKRAAGELHPEQPAGEVSGVGASAQDGLASEPLGGGDCQGQQESLHSSQTRASLDQHTGSQTYQGTAASKESQQGPDGFGCSPAGGSAAPSAAKHVPELLGGQGEVVEGRLDAELAGAEAGVPADLPRRKPKHSFPLELEWMRKLNTEDARQHLMNIEGAAPR